MCQTTLEEQWFNRRSGNFVQIATAFAAEVTLISWCVCQLTMSFPIEHGRENDMADFDRPIRGGGKWINLRLKICKDSLGNCLRSSKDIGRHKRPELGAGFSQMLVCSLSSRGTNSVAMIVESLAEASPKSCLYSRWQPLASEPNLLTSMAFWCMVLSIFRNWRCVGCFQLLDLFFSILNL